MIDLKRLNRLVAIDTVDGLATVGAGMNGGQFEEALAERGVPSTRQVSVLVALNEVKNTSCCVPGLNNVGCPRSI